MKKEIISKFKEKPKTKTAWRAMYLGLATLLIPPFLGIFAAVIRPMIDKISVNSENVGISIGFGVGILALVLSVSALVIGIRAYKKGERSWVFMIIGELIFPH